MVHVGVLHVGVVHVDVVHVSVVRTCKSGVRMSEQYM